MHFQVRRKSSDALQGKNSFGTLRDLFRWAERYRLSENPVTGRFYDWDQHIADEGYLVLSGKTRKPAEALVVQEILHKRFKRNPEPDNLFTLHDKTSLVTKSVLEKVLKGNRTKDGAGDFQHIVWTFEMRKLAVLVGSAIKFAEPILLVGETGCGKTTVVQYIAECILGRKLYSVNCHMHCESSDFVGGLRPSRDQVSRLFILCFYFS